MPKILYVEDHPVQRAIIAQTLADHGYDVATANNGIEGIAVALAWQPDLILTDLRKPLMDGFEMIAHLRAKARFQTVPIIVISAWASRNDKQQALDVGADIHISKPPDLNHLLKTIRAFLDQRFDRAA